LLISRLIKKAYIPTLSELGVGFNQKFFGKLTKTNDKNLEEHPL